MHAMLKDSLAGKVALVTGAGSGIGKATAKLLAYSGARIAALGPTRDELEETCLEIRHGGHEALGLVADVSDVAQMEHGVGQIREAWGRLDIVIANAGINGLWAPVEEIGAEEWDKTFGVNLKGTFLAVKLAVPLLKVHGGAIVFVSSVNGTRIFSNAGASAYATTKAGQVALARMMALELAPSGIRVNTVCPGSIETKIGDSTRQQNVERVRPAILFPNGHIPLTGGKPGTAGQVAELIWFLVSPLASHITGAEVFIDGGESLLRG